MLIAQYAQDGRHVVTAEQIHRGRGVVAVEDVAPVIGRQIVNGEGRGAGRHSAPFPFCPISPILWAETLSRRAYLQG